MPSSNSFMASSRGRLAHSSLRTISSRRAKDCSNACFFSGSVFLPGVEFKPLPLCAPAAF